MSLSNNNQYDSSQTLTLPHHLISEEILPKLPVKSLIRFKSVSKSWLSTISSPNFPKTHLNFSSLRPQFLILIGIIDGHDFKNEILSLHYDESSCKIEDSTRFESGFRSDCPIQFMGLVGICNGLVCFHVVREIKSFFVWNPATRLTRRVNFPCNETTTWSYACDFSYELVKDEYRIFAVFLSNVDYLAHCYVFNLRNGEWKRFDDLSKCFPVIEIKDVVLVGDVVYLFRISNHIVGFDLVSEEMNEFEKLNWLDKYKKTSLLQLRGCLSLLCFGSENGVYDVWMLKRNSDWNSWEKVYSVDFSNVVYCGISENVKCLIHHDGQLKVVDLNSENGTVDLSQKGVDFDTEGKFVLRSHGYVESLVSPF